MLHQTDSDCSECTKKAPGTGRWCAPKDRFGHIFDCFYRKDVTFFQEGSDFRTAVKVIMPSFQEALMDPLYCVTMLSAMERPMP